MAIGGLKGLRRPTLEDTYLNVAKFIKAENNGEKTVLKEIVEGKVENELDAFDQSIRLIIVDAAKLYDQLAKILFENDEGVIRRAVKCKWFFETAPIEFFTDELLPVVSVSTRLKVISVLGRVLPENDAIRMFEWVRVCFGLQIAEPLLSRCPEPYIARIVLSEIRPISPKTFASITRKFPSLGVQLAATWTKKGQSVPEVVRNILVKHPELFAVWNDEDVSRLGIKIGRKLLGSWRPRLVTAESWGWLRRGVNKRLFAKLSHEERVLHLTLTAGARGVPNISDWKDDFFSLKDLIKTCTPEDREKLFHETFQIIFHADLWSSREACTPSLLELITKERRDFLMTSLDLNDECYLYLKPPSIAIPQLILKVKKCSDAQKRSEYVIAMIGSCCLAWDMEQLQAVLEFVEDDLKDDLIAAKTAIKVLRFNVVSALSLAGSRVLVSIASRLRHNNRGMCYDDLLFPYEVYLTRCLEIGESVEPALTAWLRAMVAGEKKWCYETITILRNPKAPLAPAIVKLLYKGFPQLVHELPHDSYYLLRLTLSLICVAGEAGVDLTAMDDRGARIFQVLDECSSCWDNDLGDALWRYGLARHYSGPGLWTIYAKHHVLVNLFRARPDFFIRDIHKVISAILPWPYRQTRFLRCRSILAFFKLDEKIASLCEDKFRDEHAAEDEKERALFIYSFVVSVERYQSLAGDFLVNGARIETSGGNTVLFLKAPYYLKNMSSPDGLFQLIRGCLIGGGDLFYAALATFHKACLNVPYASAVEEVLPLLNSSVAVMKKAVGLVAQLCPRDEAFRHFRQSWKTAKHYSARTVLLEHMFRLFLDDVSDEKWKAVKEMMPECDDELLLSLPSLDRIPDAYAHDYIQTVWEMLVKLDASNKNKSIVENTLMTDVVRRAHLLSDELCRAMISPTLFTPNSVVNKLALRYLALCPTLTEAKVKFIKDLFDERSKTHPKAVVDFVGTMVNEEFSEVCKFLPNFMQTLGDAFLRMELFEARWPLLYLKEKQKTMNDGKIDTASLVSLGSAISKLWLSQPDRAFLIPLLAKSLQQVFESRQLLAVGSGMVCEDPVMRCCEVMQDYEMYEKVIEHITSHHRNDEDVLSSWCDYVYNTLQPTLPLTPACWDLLDDLVRYIAAKYGYCCLSFQLPLWHAQMLVLNDKDPTPKIERLLQLEPDFPCRPSSISKELLPHLVRILRKAIIEGGHDQSLTYLLTLIRLKTPDLTELVTALCTLNRPILNRSYCSTIAISALWQYPPFKHILEIDFPELNTGDVPKIVNCLWRCDPFLVIKNIEAVVLSLLKVEQGTDCIVLKDRAKMAFFKTKDKIQKVALNHWAEGNTATKKNILRVLARTCDGGEYWDTTRFLINDSEPRIQGLAFRLDPVSLAEIECRLKGKEWSLLLSSGKVCAASKRAPQNHVIRSCQALLALGAGEHAIGIMSGACLLSNVAELISAHAGALKRPAEYLAALRCLWKHFLLYPSDETWMMVHNMAINCHPQSVRRVLFIKNSPVPFFGRIAEFIWNRLESESDETKVKFIRVIPDEFVRLIPVGIMPPMIDLVGTKDCKFIFKCWNVDPSNHIITQMLMKKLRDEKFAENFVECILLEAKDRNSEGRKELIKAVLNESLLSKIGAHLLYRVQLFDVMLLGQYQTYIPRFIRHLADAELVWPEVARALLGLLLFLKMDLLTFLWDMMMRSESRVERVLIAYMLPQSVPLPGRYVVDPLVHTYAALMKALHAAQDPAVDVYLHMHLNNRRSEYGNDDEGVRDSGGYVEQV